MNRIIIASPYSGNIERNVAYAREALRHSLEQGEAPFAPHLLYPVVLDDNAPKERERGMQAGFEWITTCDLVAFYIDYGWSSGMIQELKVARLYHRKIEVRGIYGRAPRNISPYKEPIEVRELLSYWNIK